MDWRKYFSSIILVLGCWSQRGVVFSALVLVPSILVTHPPPRLNLICFHPPRVTRFSMHHGLKWPSLFPFRVPPRYIVWDVCCCICCAGHVFQPPRYFCSLTRKGGGANWSHLLNSTGSLAPHAPGRQAAGRADWCRFDWIILVTMCAVWTFQAKVKTPLIVTSQRM